MAPRDDDKASSGGPGPAGADDVATCKESKTKAEEDSSPAAAADETVDFDEDFDEDPFVWNLNRMRRQNMLTPERIEAMKKQHYEFDALFTKLYYDMDNDDGEVDDEAGAAEFKEYCDQVWESARARLSSLNIVGGEDCGMDAVGVYGGRSRPHREDQAVAAPCSSQDATK